MKKQPPEVTASLGCSDGVPDDGLNMPAGGQQSGKLLNSEFLADVGCRLCRGTILR